MKIPKNVRYTYEEMFGVYRYGKQSKAPFRMQSKDASSIKEFVNGLNNNVKLQILTSKDIPEDKKELEYEYHKFYVDTVSSFKRDWCAEVAGFEADHDKTNIMNIIKHVSNSGDLSELKRPITEENFVSYIEERKERVDIEEVTAFKNFLNSLNIPLHGSKVLQGKTKYLSLENKATTKFRVSNGKGGKKNVQFSKNSTEPNVGALLWALDLSNDKSPLFNMRLSAIDAIKRGKLKVSGDKPMKIVKNEEISEELITFAIKQLGMLSDYNFVCNELLFGKVWNEDLTSKPDQTGYSPYTGGSSVTTIKKDNYKPQFETLSVHTKVPMYLVKAEERDANGLSDEQLIAEVINAKIKCVQKARIYLTNLGIKSGRRKRLDKYLRRVIK